MVLQGLPNYLNDPDNDPLILTRIGTVKYGSVSTPQGLGVDKPIMYKPNPAFITDPSKDLLDSLSFTVSDGRGGSDSGHIEITICKALLALHKFTVERLGGMCDGAASSMTCHHW
jgi:hypothetical protein